jgi:hypothetical protein
VHVEGRLRFLDERPETIDHGRPEGDVRHEVPIHHVHVQPVTPGVNGFAAVIGEPAEIRAED